MKKSLAAVATALLMLVGFVSATSANAAAPYVGSVTTHCGARQPNKNGAHDVPKLYLVVTPGHPIGTMKIVFTDKATKAVTRTSINYTGNFRTYQFSMLKKNHKYTAKLTYSPNAGGVYKPCTPITLQTVTY